MQFAESKMLFEQAAIIAGMACLSYLIGAIPTGYLLGRMKGVDIRTLGSGNIGATNVWRCLGKGWGILTFALDFLKGYLPAFLFPIIIQHCAAGMPLVHLSLDRLVQSLLFGCLAVSGHNWPVFLRFRGGKGIATGTGALLGFAPVAMLIGIISWLLVFLVTRYVSLASMAAALIIAVSSWWLYAENMLVPAALSVMTIIVVWRHNANIKRLVNGTENRFEFKRKNPVVSSQKSEVKK
jgi:glycerol-3-phosphate acyltransferase PlsY